MVLFRPVAMGYSSSPPVTPSPPLSLPLSLSLTLLCSLIVGMQEEGWIVDRLDNKDGWRLGRECSTMATCRDVSAMDLILAVGELVLSSSLLD